MVNTHPNIILVQGWFYRGMKILACYTYLNGITIKSKKLLHLYNIYGLFMGSLVEILTFSYTQNCTPSVSYQKLRFTKYVGLRSFFAFLARNCVRCIALTKHFPVSQGCPKNQKKINTDFISMLMAMLMVSNHYKIPHMGKAALQRRGELPHTLRCLTEIVRNACEFVEGNTPVHHH